MGTIHISTVSRCSGNKYRDRDHILNYRYFIVGVWNTLFGFGIFTLLMALAPKSWYLYSLTISTMIAITQAYFTQRMFVWRSQASIRNEFIRFSSVFLIQFAVNLFLLYLFVEKFKTDPLWTQYVVGSSLILSSYFFHKYWTFKA